MANIKKALFGNTATNDQPQTKKPDRKGSDESDTTTEPVETGQTEPTTISDSDGPTFDEPTGESQPETSSEHTGEGGTDDYMAPSDQTRS